MKTGKNLDGVGVILSVSDLEARLKTTQNVL
jgi:hypothetical protein